MRKSARDWEASVAFVVMLVVILVVVFVVGGGGGGGSGGSGMSVAVWACRTVWSVMEISVLDATTEMQKESGAVWLVAAEQ